VTQSGFTVAPGITIPADAQSIVISESGEVRYFTQGGAIEGTVAGQFQLAVFANPAGLVSIGQNYFLETAASGAPQQGNPAANGFGALKQYFVEASNVNLAEELVSMIVAQRSYEINTRAISASDDMLQRLGQM
jgi:flagellar basal-body rod protein FlgG